MIQGLIVDTYGIGEGEIAVNKMVEITSKINKNEVASLQVLLNKIANALALLEQAEDKLEAREQLIREHEHYLEAKLKESEEQIESLQSSFHQFQESLEENLDELGLARLRLILKQGEEHVQSIQDSTAVFSEQAKEVFEKLDRTAVQASQQLSKALKSFNAYEIRKISDESCYQIQKASQSALRQISSLTKRAQWKIMGLSFSIALMVTMTMGLYLNDEWPWETHTKINQQRNLAQAVINSWPNLSVPDQQNIEHSLSQKG